MCLGPLESKRIYLIILVVFFAGAIFGEKERQSAGEREIKKEVRGSSGLVATGAWHARHRSPH